MTSPTQKDKATPPISILNKYGKVWCGCCGLTMSADDYFDHECKEVLSR